jgi:DNA-binding CsgD family transcriptional regulator
MRRQHQTKPQESEMAMPPFDQIAAAPPRNSASGITATPSWDRAAWSRGTDDVAAGPAWEIVSSAERAAAALRMAQLEVDIEATRKALHNAQADLKRIHETLQSGTGISLDRAGQVVSPPKSVGVPGEAGMVSVLRHQACTSVASLTRRQREVLDLVLDGHPSKNIAADLGISQRTVDNHRAAIMRKTGSKSMPALVRTVMAAA